jgi:hypothetical protein
MPTNIWLIFTRQEWRILRYQDSGLIAIGNDVCAKVSGGATSDAARDWLVGHLAHGGYQASNAEAGMALAWAAIQRRV